MQRLFFFLFLLLASNLSLIALPLGPHAISIGPEFYHLKRDKESGSSQKGWLYGGHLIYERRVDNGFYWELDSYYATGTLNGKSGNGNTLKSDIFEYELEGCIGYSFCKTNWKHLTFLPYGGYGYFNSHNHFKKPSPRIYKTEESYQYGAGGAELSFRPKRNLECGIRWEVQYMTEGKCVVDDKTPPSPETLHQIVKNEVQYEIDLLCRYRALWNGRTISILISPFYQKRHLGGEMNWPYNFIETRFYNIGLRCLVQCIF